MVLSKQPSPLISSTKNFRAIFEADLQGTEKFLEQIIDHVDLERNATLNFAEFLVLMVKSQGVNGVQRAFLSYDVDASGSISRDELKDWMTRHGRFLTRRQVDMMVGAVDVNGDGEIDYHEFLVRLRFCWKIHSDVLTIVILG